MFPFPMESKFVSENIYFSICHLLGLSDINESTLFLTSLIVQTRELYAVLSPGRIPHIGTR